jgi:hypothetical protein
MAAHAAKPAFKLDEMIAAGTPNGESASASGTELAAAGVLALAVWAFHGRSSGPLLVAAGLQ